MLNHILQGATARIGWVVVVIIIAAAVLLTSDTRQEDKKEKKSATITVPVSEVMPANTTGISSTANTTIIKEAADEADSNRDTTYVGCVPPEQIIGG